MKKILVALAGLAVAASALAQLATYKDWDKSPEAYFLTPPERAEWSKVTSDEEAATFVALYYARRGGEPFKQEISRRIAAADQQFKMSRYKRGADSVRGRLLIVLGAPSRVSQQRAPGGVDSTGGVTAPAISTQMADASAPILYTWTYEKTKFDPSWDLPELRVSISVEPAVGTDSFRNGASAERAMATIAEKSIVNPNATLEPAKAPAAPVAPVAPAAATGGAGSAPAAAAAAPAILLPAAVKSALEAAAGQPPADAFFWFGTFRSPAGDPFLALQFYLPSDKPAFAGNAPLKFGALVTDAGGAEVQSDWEEATFAEIVEGSRKDRVFDHSIALAPGSYKGVFGLFAAEGQPPVTSSTVSFTLEPKSSDLEVSPLILSAGLVPLTRQPGPTDPFVFGVEKPIRVDPKGDSRFSKQDSLWFFYTVANPVLPAAAPAEAPAADAAATPGAPAPAAPADAPKPRIMTRINVQKDGKDAFAPFTGPAELQPLSGGYYGAGSEIPLASFEPGYYLFQITVRDLNAPKGTPASKGLERKQEFIVLMPDGSLPPKAAPAPPKKKT